MEKKQQKLPISPIILQKHWPTGIMKGHTQIEQVECQNGLTKMKNSTNAQQKVSAIFDSWNLMNRLN